ncbi:MAG: ribbon-helix-helix domain-containing protein [Oscillospiraceae bacterium]
MNFTLTREPEIGKGRVHIRVDTITYDKLLALSKETNIPMTRLVAYMVAYCLPRTVIKEMQSGVYDYESNAADPN